MADWLPKPVFIWREWRTAARQGLPTLILSISGSLSNERVKESGIALLQGLPCAQPAPFPEGSGTLCWSCCKTWWHGHCQIWEFLQDRPLGLRQLVAEQREGSGVWHLPLPPEGLCPCTLPTTASKFTSLTACQGLPK